jgi:hypothetical protein
VRQNLAQAAINTSPFCSALPTDINEQHIPVVANRVGLDALEVSVSELE